MSAPRFTQTPMGSQVSELAARRAAGEARSSARPTCERCGTETVRAASTPGAGQYTCPSPSCADSFKRWYTRDGEGGS